MTNKFRVLQLITGVHRIHHIWWSYGWKLPLLPIAYFPAGAFDRKKGWKIVRKEKYHNCTKTGKY